MKSRRRYRRIAAGGSGFTLIELLVSSAILALMVSIVYGTFSRATAATDKAEKFIDINHAARFIVDRMMDDLASASLPANNTKAVFLGEPGASEEGGRLDKITFYGYGRRLIMPGAASDQAIVSWYAVRTPDKKAYTLIRSESFNVTGEPKEDDPSAAAFAVTENLVSMEIGYKTAGQPDAEWGEAFDSKESKTVPDVVSVKFTLRDEGGNEVIRSALMPVGEKL